MNSNLIFSSIIPEMKKSFILFFIFFLAFTTNLVSQTKIKMEKTGGVYSIPCKVNGITLKFIFDTGASDVSLSLTEAMFMLKNGYLSKEDIGEQVYYQLANGDVAKGTKILLRKIEFGGFSLYNVSASIVHESSSPLLLGQTAISKLGKIQLEGDVLTILNTSNKSSYDFTTNSNTNISATETYVSKSKFKSEFYTSDVEIGFVSNLPELGTIENETYNKNYSAQTNTFTFAPIKESPSFNSKTIGLVSNNTVSVLERINEKFYKVKSGDFTGFLWAGWFDTLN
jgi:clan AA aspartic protease (TIGR02281 family)